MEFLVNISTFAKSLNSQDILVKHCILLIKFLKENILIFSHYNYVTSVHSYIENDTIAHVKKPRSPFNF